MTRRGLGRPGAGRRRVPQRRGDRLAGLARAPGARRVVPAAVQRPPRGLQVHDARRRVRRGVDARVRHGAARGRGRRGGDRGGRRRSSSSTTRWCCCDASPDDGAAGDVPAAADERLRVRRGARAGALPARPRRSRTCTCRRPSRRARGRRTATTSSTRPRSRTSSAARAVHARSCDAAQRGRAGDRARHRPEPHGDRRREPLLGGSRAAARSSSTSTRRRAATGASSTSITWPAVRQEDPEVFDGDARRWRCGWCATGAVDGLRIDHPDGLADPAGYLQRLRDRGVEHVWVEKILDPGEPLRDWPVDGTVGYEFLNDVCALFVDPAGEAPLTDLWVEVSGDDRRFADWAFEAKLEQARTTFAPEVERLLREAPERVAGLERALASLPVYRTYVEPWSGKVTDEDREAVGEARAAGVAGLAAAARGPGLGGVRHPLPADDAAGHGQGRRGHRVLPLRAAARVERRRRGPGALERLGRGLPRGQPRAGGALPAQPAGHPDARHQALGRRARADRRAGVDARRVRARTCARGCRSAAR